MTRYWLMKSEPCEVSVDDALAIGRGASAAQDTQADFTAAAGGYRFAGFAGAENGQPTVDYAGRVRALAHRAAAAWCSQLGAVKNATMQTPCGFRQNPVSPACYKRADISES